MPQAGQSSRRRRVQRAALAAEETGVASLHYAPGQLERETLDMLELPELCAQLAAFTSTPLGDAVLRGGLHLGATRAESELLLRLTAQAGAMDARLDFSGVHDVRASLDTAARGAASLPGDALVRIGTTLVTALRLRDVLLDGAAGPDLQSLAATLCAPPLELGDLLLRSLSMPGGTILDAASAELAAVRAKRRDTAQRLRLLLQSTAVRLVAQGAADAAQVVSRRNRLCVPVKRGMTGLLPGCVVLDQSFSGATLFVEPPEGTGLNNDAAALEAQHEELEKAILKELTAQVDANAASLQKCVTALVSLDAAVARARHGAWLGATSLPVFSAAGGSGTPEVLVQQASHPLLLGAALPPPPLRWWELEAAQAAAEAAALAALPGREPSEEQLVLETVVAHDVPRPAAPVPVDWRVPPGARCVVITGANTGGKTASMKTLALCCLLARAGAFIPASGDSTQPPCVPWVRTVLADMGDGQSLASGLSTFGGHVARLAAILRNCSPKRTEGSPQGTDDLSLVLLDEPGAGTDPDEGAALACAMLSKLATWKTLTVATSHYDGVKRLADLPLDEAESPAGVGWCVNAAVEFDERSLRPTYRLLWNATGKSYAINAAIHAGLPQRVIDTAMELMKRSAARGERVETKTPSTTLAETLVAQLNEAMQGAQAAQQARVAAESEADAQQSRAEALKKGLKALLAAAEADARAAESAASAAFASVVAAQDPEAAWEEALKTHLPSGWEYVGGSSGAVRRRASDSGAEELLNTAEKPLVGSLVRVASLGTRRLATVVDVADDMVTVRMGSLTSHVPLADVLPADDGAADDDEQEEAARARKRAAMPKVSRAAAARNESDFLTPRATNSSDGETLMAIVPQTASTMVDVRGMYATEAVAAVEAAIGERGRMRGASIMHVVHGVGTGRVKAAVQDYLRTNALVAKMQQAAPRDGGAGCTVVFLR